MYLPIKYEAEDEYYTNLQYEFFKDIDYYFTHTYESSGNDIVTTINIPRRYINKYKYFHNGKKINESVTKTLEYGGFMCSNFYLFNGKRYDLTLEDNVLGFYNDKPLIKKNNKIYYEDVEICEYIENKFELLDNYLIKSSWRTEEEEEIDTFLLDIKSKNPKFKLLDINKCPLGVINVENWIFIYSDNKLAIEVSKSFPHIHKRLMVKYIEINKSNFDIDILEYRNILTQVFYKLKKKLSRGVACIIMKYTYQLY
jgi:hypothetical protein